MSPWRKPDPRVKELSERLQRMIDDGHPLVDLVLKWQQAMLDEWEAPGGSALPSPFGESPLLRLVESMLPSVDAQDPDSGAMIRALTRRTDLVFEQWAKLRTQERRA